ncbi:MAG: glycosyltransferase family 4 protein [Lutibacter sp.]|uniref:glycosyltransferase family 4 protein n=1 Tax=Lutibacter sp. TaxID=1925666 RepID=UPI00299D007C|nr:glycosyltransferase family 4 protein [Lutibacter sp.]MDX1829154.1 glycosyltransferase family 4 protein [Lutibacter sp.]
MKRALIITYYWPPAGGSGVQRWLKFVKYFRDFDIEPIVYTVKNANYPISDESLLKEIPKDIEILKQPIWEPNNLFSLGKKKSKQSAGFLNNKPSLFGKILQYVRANYFIPDARKFWINPSVSFLKKYLKNNQIDILITTGPPHSVHLIGLKLKEELNLKWIADFRDPWVDIDYFHHLPLTKKSLKKHQYLERNVVKNADAVMVVGNTMKENYLKFNKNIVTITNGFDDDIAMEKVTLDTKFSITHIGLMNSDRNPVLFWRVLKEIGDEKPQFLNDLNVNLIGKIDKEILNSIFENELTKKVNVINYVPHNKIGNYQKTSQILLLVVNNVPSAKGIITGKIFEYLKAKRPILVIAPNKGDLANIIKDTNAGFVIDYEDKELLKSTILALYTSYKKGNLYIDSKNIEQYHRKELTKNVATLIKNITK